MTKHPLLVALTSEVSNSEISPSELAQCAAALQRQANEDLRPAWSHVNATVQACPDPARLPFGYAPITVKDQLDEPGAAGYHTDDNGQPYSLVAYEPGPGGWPLTCSHEFVEMALDPLGSTLYRAHSPDPDEPDRRKVVRVLLELGDPCEDGRYGYDVNGLRMSDFILHAYGNGHAGPFDKTNHVGRALEVLPGGYISWQEPDGTWKQLTYFDSSGPQVVTLGKRTGEHRTLREWVDSQTCPVGPSHPEWK